jgi:hypothetical protein
MAEALAYHQSSSLHDQPIIGRLACKWGQEGSRMSCLWLDLETQNLETDLPRACQNFAHF